LLVGVVLVLFGIHGGYLSLSVGDIGGDLVRRGLIVCVLPVLGSCVVSLAVVVG
jgi:hypothetical protein